MTRTARFAATVRRSCAALATLLGGVLVAACQAPAGQSSTGPTLSPGSGALDLAAVCPATVVMQAAWTPEAEHGALYHLLGETYTIDAASQEGLRARWWPQGKDTGVKVEIRAGGPAIGFQNAGRADVRRPVDHAGPGGHRRRDRAVGQAAGGRGRRAVRHRALHDHVGPGQRTRAFNSIVDIGKTNTKVLYFNGATYMDYLIGSGILKRDQVDGAYDGSPTRFLAEQGKIAQQGFATNEPFIYEKALPQWKKPVKFQLIHDTGYPIYPEAIVVRADKKAEHAAVPARSWCRSSSGRRSST